MLERAKGFEPSTPTLARLCSTPELRPRAAAAGAARRALPRRPGPAWQGRSGALPCHPSVQPDAPEGWQRDQELKEALDAAQAAPEGGGPAAGHLPRPLRRGFFSAGKG